MPGNDLKIAPTVRHVGDIHRFAGRAASAEPCYEEALNLYRANHQTTSLDLANAIRGLAILKFDTSDSPRAISLWTEARNLCAAVGVQGRRCRKRSPIGSADWARGRLTPANALD